jgi:prepilin-type N-terminal cleavage/methylation domain-containing protein
MKIHLNDVHAKAKGFTLIEISLVIGLLLGLATFAGMNMYAVRKWQKGKDAAVSLQGVLAAQKAYLSDHPTASMASVNVAQLNAYLPQGWAGMPVIEGLDDELLTIDHNVMPPVFMLSGSIYDPSGSSSDGLWDTGY